jgi:hypothetical protein
VCVRTGSKQEILIDTEKCRKIQDFKGITSLTSFIGLRRSDLAQVQV